MVAYVLFVWAAGLAVMRYRLGWPRGRRAAFSRSMTSSLVTVLLMVRK